MHLFPYTLPALFDALTESGNLFEVIIVDDCSTDNSVEFLQGNFPQVRLLINSSNSGFSKTINTGIFAAKNDLVLLLNSDVKLTSNYFADQLKYFLSDDTFGVMGKIIGWDDEIVQDGAKYPRFEGFKLKTSFNYLIKDEHKPLQYSMYLSGANALVDRQKLLQLAGFDEIFTPFYMEDVDLSVRAWRVGWKCYFEPLSICRHRVSTSIATKEKKQFIKTVYNRNKMYFHAIHLDGLSLLGWYLQTIFELVFRTILCQFYFLKAFIVFLKNGKRVKDSKSKLGNLTKQIGGDISLHALSREIQGSVLNQNITFFKR
ncbi:Glycosyltransferase, GT2 family [Daejeonella lutea]|uniref:Glycosyltransferase, GT2 family n=1 Tax=Daejeonella lutea TaxID=572036 RepID=A0A1T5DE40_9SPHI|nr:Glycosyltransferase, GT2 family [Daejeonella lutea]